MLDMPKRAIPQGVATRRIAALRADLVLTDPGPQDLDVTAALTRIFDISPPVARRIVEDAPSLLAIGMARPAARRLAARLEALGASVAHGGYERLRAEADANRADICLADAGPDPEAVTLALVAATGRDLETLRGLVAGATPWAPVPVATDMLPARARAVAAAISATGAAAVAVPAGTGRGELQPPQ